MTTILGALLTLLALGAVIRLMFTGRPVFRPGGIEQRLRSRASFGGTAALVLLVLSVCQLLFSSAVSVSQLSDSIGGPATLLVLATVAVLMASVRWGARIITAVGSVIGVVNVAIQHGPLAAVAVTVMLVLLLTLVALSSVLFGRQIA